MLETRGLGLMIFMGINVAAVGFLLYVLVQFWREEHKSGKPDRLRSRMSAYGAGPEVIVALSPVARETRHQDARLIQFPVRTGNGQQRGEANGSADRTQNAPRSVAL
jgi:hypothetical protein